MFINRKFAFTTFVALSSVILAACGSSNPECPAPEAAPQAALETTVSPPMEPSLTGLHPSTLPVAAVTAGRGPFPFGCAEGLTPIRIYTQNDNVAEIDGTTVAVKVTREEQLIPEGRYIRDVEIRFDGPIPSIEGVFIEDIKDYVDDQGEKRAYTSAQKANWLPGMDIGVTLSGDDWVYEIDTLTLCARL